LAAFGWILLYSFSVWLSWSGWHFALVQSGAFCVWLLVIDVVMKQWWLVCAYWVWCGGDWLHLYCGWCVQMCASGALGLLDVPVMLHVTSVLLVACVAFLGVSLVLLGGVGVVVMLLLLLPGAAGVAVGPAPVLCWAPCGVALQVCWCLVPGCLVGG
jgi:hypothetical protein